MYDRQQHALLYLHDMSSIMLSTTLIEHTMLLDQCNLC